MGIEPLHYKGNASLRIFKTSFLVPSIHGMYEYVNPYKLNYQNSNMSAINLVSYKADAGSEEKLCNLYFDGL